MTHMQRTETGYNVEAPKKRFNVSLNEDLVRVVQSLTDNLSGTVETLLAAYLAEERRKPVRDKAYWDEASAYWNAFDEKFGRVADEYNQDFIGGDDDR
jgi:antitoxin CcdA